MTTVYCAPRTPSRQTHVSEPETSTAAAICSFCMAGAPPATETFLCRVPTPYPIPWPRNRSWCSHLVFALSPAVHSTPLSEHTTTHRKHKQQGRIHPSLPHAGYSGELFFQHQNYAHPSHNFLMRSPSPNRAHATALRRRHLTLTATSIAEGVGVNRQHGHVKSPVTSGRRPTTASLDVVRNAMPGYRWRIAIKFAIHAADHAFHALATQLGLSFSFAIQLVLFSGRSRRAVGHIFLTVAEGCETRHHREPHQPRGGRPLAPPLPP